MSNAPSTLAELVSPLSESEFLELLRTRKLTLIRGAGRERYSALLNWSALINMIQRGEHPSSLAEFSLVKDSMLAPPDRWLKPNPSGAGNMIDMPNFLAYISAGFSLAVRRLEVFAPHLKILSEDIRHKVREQIRMGVIVTKGQGGAFTLHYDPEDLVILQVEGKKRWKIFGPQVVNPIMGAPQNPPSEDDLLFDEVLEAGDFLFLPSGHWHRCENQSSRSLHLGIFFQPPRGIDVIKSLTSRLLSDEQLRLPLTRLADVQDLSVVEDDIRARAIEQIGKLDLKEFFSEFEGG